MKTLRLALLVIATLLAATVCTTLRAEQHDVVKIYEKVELKDGTLDEDGKEIDYIYEEIDLDAGEYKVEIGTRVNSYLYNIRGTNLYLKFRYAPYLWQFDEGVLMWSVWGGGTFYKADN